MSAFALVACDHARELNVAGEAAGAVSQVQALIGPDQDLEDVPAWLRPYVRPSAVLARYLAGELELKAAQQALQTAVQECGCAIGSNARGAAEVLVGVDSLFSFQTEVAHTAVRASLDGRPWGGAVLPDEWGCGTKTPGPKWPPPRGIRDLLKVQRELLSTELPALTPMKSEEVKALQLRIDQRTDALSSLLQ